MKRWFSLVLALLLICALGMPALASTSAVIDRAGLLDEDEISDLEVLLEELSADHDMDAVVLTVDSLEGQSARDYATDYYDARYGDDGVLVLVAIEEREWYFLTAGSCKSRIPDDALEGDFVELLSNGEYDDAFRVFVDTCYRYMSDQTGTSATDRVYMAIGSCIVGIIVGMIVVLVMKSKLKSVRPQAGADQYVGADSLQLTQKSDIFLYQTVTRRAKPQQNTGSSGRSYGGGGGRF